MKKAKKAKATKKPEKKTELTPNNVVITKEAESTVEGIMKALTGRNVFVRYIRTDPTIVKVNGKLRIARGAPIGALVALNRGGNVFIGWSKRHSTKETKPFTKTNAVRVAVLRALLDVVSVKGKIVTTKSKTIVPKRIQNNIIKFIDSVINRMEIKRNKIVNLET